MLPTPSEKLIERALALIVRHDLAPEGQAGPARQALDQWCARSDAHRAAAQEARLRWDTLGGLSRDLGAHFPADAAPPPGVKRGRRALLLSLAGLAGTGALVARALQWHWQQPVFTAAYDSRTAEILRLTLPDGDGGQAGSELVLAPRTALDVQFYRQRRVVNLARGEVRFEVAHDSGRPFVVMARQARIEVVGTVFTVRDRGGAVTVGVERGHVRVTVLPRAGGADAPPGAAPAIDLRRGELLDIRDGLAAPVARADADALSAWREGWLVFDNAPLGEALATVNAYRTRPIVSADARVAALRLSGRFRAGDSAGLLAMLPGVLPLAVHTRADGSVLLSLR